MARTLTSERKARADVVPEHIITHRGYKAHSSVPSKLQLVREARNLSKTLQIWCSETDHQMCSLMSFIPEKNGFMIWIPERSFDKAPIRLN